ncbi:MAG: GNAT family N-acetyltransferase [Ruminococcaceae bacterium]|nr:GNAT family N-acetyltransferase [Oscillospiraceae bacterium]
MLRITENELSADLFYELYISVGWEPPLKEQIAVALNNTIAAFTVYDDNNPVAMARLIGDGGMSYYIKDFAVIPTEQKKGIGTMLMKHIENYIIKNLKPNWAVSLELISSKGKEPFYEKMGFEARPCEWDGAGMFKMVRYTN